MGLLIFPGHLFASTIGGWGGVFLIFSIPIVIAMITGFLVGLITGFKGKRFNFTLGCILISLFCLHVVFFVIDISPFFHLNSELGRDILTLTISLGIGMLPAIATGYLSHLFFRK